LGRRRRQERRFDREATRYQMRQRMLSIGDDYAQGNFVDHEYTIERDGDKIAEVSKRWFRVRDTYGVEVVPDETTC
jgi:uncharacterized protein YxjI